MNSVNLLPTKHRPRTPTGGLQGSAYVVVGVLAAVLLMVVFYVLTVNSVNTRKDAVARARAETAEAQARVAQLSAYGDFSKVKEQRVLTVKQLASGRIDWERLTLGLARVLPNDVWLTAANASASGQPGSGGASSPTPSSSSATPGAATGSPSVELTGCAPSHDEVAVTLVRLKELSGAQDVQLNEITQPDTPSPGTGGTAGSSAAASGAGGDTDCGTIHGKVASKWDATITFAPGAGTAATGVPKSLGGGA